MAVKTLRELLIEISTDVGSVKLEWEDGQSTVLEGRWGGESWYDYYKRRVRISEDRQTV